MQEAEDAIRDILGLYYQLNDYNGIVGDHWTGALTLGASWTAHWTTATAGPRLRHCCTKAQQSRSSRI